jgi:hypothetical protein
MSTYPDLHMWLEERQDRVDRRSATSEDLTAQGSVPVHMWPG